MASARLLLGDMRQRLRELADCSVDAVVTDPPYHLASIVKRFGSPSAAPLNNADAKAGRWGPYHRTSSGFMGQTWDGGDVAFDPETWAEVFRVLKPGGHLVAFGATRNYHRLACAIEDSGFELRDLIAWLYGSGFPKSHDVSKGLDRQAGAEREVVGEARSGRGPRAMNPGGGARNVADSRIPTAPATDEARAWDGWGTALKPALEPIALARKPLSERTVPANVLRWGTGALNIDGARLDCSSDDDLSRWPSNVAHDGSDEVLVGLPEGASRFFYCAKATTEERGEGNVHPTVKPVALLCWLIRLVTPTNGLVLDPFLGSGSTGIAAEMMQRPFIGIELKPDYLAVAERRLRDRAGLFAQVSVDRAEVAA